VKRSQLVTSERGAAQWLLGARLYGIPRQMSAQTTVLTRCTQNAMLSGSFGGSMAETEHEKRATRRFALRLPVAVTYTDNGSQQKTAQTRDVSARGICFYVDSAIAAGSVIEFTLTLPPEITLTESIRVRCKGKVVRVDDGEGKIAVAAVIDEYEFLAEP